MQNTRKDSLNNKFNDLNLSEAEIKSIISKRPTLTNTYRVLNDEDFLES